MHPRNVPHQPLVVSPQQHTTLYVTWPVGPPSLQQMKGSSAKLGRQPAQRVVFPQYTGKIKVGHDKTAAPTHSLLDRPPPMVETADDVIHARGADGTIGYQPARGAHTPLQKCTMLPSCHTCHTREVRLINCKASTDGTPTEQRLYCSRYNLLPVPGGLRKCRYADKLHFIIFMHQARSQSAQVYLRIDGWWEGKMSPPSSSPADITTVFCLDHITTVSPHAYSCCCWLQMNPSATPFRSCA